jgi:CRP/FNR family transcriptional regulator
MLTPPAKIELIKKIPFLSALPLSNLSKISEKFEEKRFKKGEFVFWEGDPALFLYVVKEGKVKVLKHSAKGKEMVLEIMVSGGFFGGATIFARNNPASAVTEEKTTVYRLSKTDFLSLLDKYPNLAKDVISYLGQALMQAHEAIISLISAKVDKRIASVLIRLSRNHGIQTPEGILIAIRFTRQDIANIVGTTVETAIRVMSKLKKQGILDTFEGKILIKDFEKLQKLAFE